MCIKYNKNENKETWPHMTKAAEFYHRGFSGDSNDEILLSLLPSDEISFFPPPPTVRAPFA